MFHKKIALQCGQSLGISTGLFLLVLNMIHKISKCEKKNDFGYYYHCVGYLTMSYVPKIPNVWEQASEPLVIPDADRLDDFGGNAHRGTR